MGERGNLKLACWNAREYLSSIPFMRKVLSEVYVFGVCEHWLHSNRLSILNDIVNSHNVFARSSNASAAESYGSKRGQVGVAIFWRRNIPGFSRVCDVIHDRACVLRYQPQDGDVYFFVSVYLPSQGSEEDLETVLDELSEIVESREPNSQSILLGDFNWDVGSHGGPRGLRTPTRRGRYIMRFLSRHGLTAMNMQIESCGPIDTFCSHNGNSTIDYIVIPEYMRMNVKACGVSVWDALNTSYHLDVRLTLRILGKSTCPVAPPPPPPPPPPGKIKWESPETRMNFFLNAQGPLRDLTDRINSEVITADLLDTYFNDLTETLHDAAADLSRTKYVKHYKPYWNYELSQLKRVKVDTYRTWVNAGRPRAPDHPLMVAYKLSKKTFVRTIKRIAKQYENEEIYKAVRLSEIDRNSFWRLLKRCRNSCGSTNISIKRPDGDVVNNLPDVLEVWHCHFATLGIPKNNANYDERHHHEVTDFVETYNNGIIIDDDFLSQAFTSDEIRCALRNLNKGKAAGYDQISAEHIIYAGAL